ncbi:MAG: hypothetical protein ACR2FO_09080 [Actinomycetota bacterium]
MSEIGPGLEFDELRRLPIDQRPRPVEDLVEKLEQELEQMSKQKAPQEPAPQEP